jgi:HEAT repeat protein
VVIKRSSAREVSSLLHDLEHGPETAREAAAARLSVIGTRAVEGLLALVASTPAQPARLAALNALEAIADPRAEEPALHWLQHGEPPVASAAAGLLRRLLDSPRGTEVLDRLTAIVLDVGRPEGARVAALEALREMPSSVTGPVRQRLAADPSASVRAAAEAPTPADAGPSPAELLEQSAGGALPDPPGRLKTAVLEAAAVAPLPTLHRLVGVLRQEEEKSDTVEARRREWMTVRAAVHLALAERGSTVALYDLRETIERASGGPVELLAALERVGDASCLEAIAAAHARLADAPGGERWWREHLVTAFRAIMGRERLTERHAALRRIKTRWPESATSLLPRG